MSAASSPDSNKENERKAGPSSSGRRSGAARGGRSTRSTNESDLQKMIAKYNLLNLRVKRIQEDIGPKRVKEASNLMEEALEESERLATVAFSEVEGARYDAQFLVSSSTTSKQLAQALETDSKRFDPNEFVRKLLINVNGGGFLDMERGDPSHRVSSDDWAAFGRKYGQILGSVPYFSYIYGSFEPGQVLKKAATQRKTRIRIDDKDKVAKKPILVNNEETVEKAGKDMTTIEVEKLHKTVRQAFKSNGNHAIPYFELVTDTTSFSKTVENIFHSAFLIKEGVVAVDIGSNANGANVPVIEPFKEKKKKKRIHKNRKRSRGDDQDDLDEEEDEEQESAACCQSILSFSMYDWRLWVQQKNSLQ